MGEKKQPSPEALKKSSAIYAKKCIDKMFQDSSIHDNTNSYPKFSAAEMKMGRILGKGGFGTVTEVTGFSLQERAAENPRPSRRVSVKITKILDNDEEVEAGAVENRKFIAEHCIRNGGDARYAIKVLSPEILRDPASFLQGIMDMAVETRFLSDIEHPNIIKMRAIATCSPFEDEYFICMDRLYDTLQKRIKTWDSLNRRTTGLAGRFTDRKGAKGAALYNERIVKAFDLCAAMDYLHQRHILYRDLKPENVGFDIRDDIKIFDFGLAKELSETLRNDDGTYNLTEMTGSPRYMAPEVANGEPYNATCDSYSFGILFWEMMALKRPYELYTPKSLREKVYNGLHKRPPIDDNWTPMVKTFLKKCWDKDIRKRDSMSQLAKMLRKEAIEACSADEVGLDHSRRRSTFVFRPKPKRTA